MSFKVYLLLSYVVLTKAAFEGDECLKDDVIGVCRNLNKCKSAIDDLRNRKTPQICSFDKVDPIVCCLDPVSPPGSLTTTTERPPKTSHDEFVGSKDVCDPIPAEMTSKKTGQKAFDSNGPISYVLIDALSPRDAEDVSKVYKVRNIINHPEYKPPALYNDIALIETEKQLPLSSFVVPACLHVPGDDVNDTTVIASGWGLTSSDNSIGLLQVKYQKLPHEECSQKFPVGRMLPKGIDRQTQMCYKDKYDSLDSCQMDGGPIQIESKTIYCMYTIVGVASYGNTCRLQRAVMYTRIIHYLPWIESIVWPN